MWNAKAVVKCCLGRTRIFRLLHKSCSVLLLLQNGKNNVQLSWDKAPKDFCGFALNSCHTEMTETEQRFGLWPSHSQLEASHGAVLSSSAARTKSRIRRTQESTEGCYHVTSVMSGAPSYRTSIGAGGRGGGSLMT